MAKTALAKRANRPVPRDRSAVLKVCERHLSEHPNRCERLVYTARGKDAKLIAKSNEICRGCRRPLSRVLDRISTILEDAACDFCYETGRTVAVACSGFLGVKMKICEGCASDAKAALSKARRGELDEPDDE
jgi:hypothetical protein